MFNIGEKMRFWRESAVLAKNRGFGEKSCFAVLARNRVLRFWWENMFWRKTALCAFGGKTCFGGNTKFYGFGEKRIFTISAGKHVFVILARNAFLRFWREIMCFTFLAEKHIFMILAGKCVFTVLARNYVFYGFGGKTRFCGFGGKLCFVVLVGKCFFFFLSFFMSDKMIIGLSL